MGCCPCQGGFPASCTLIDLSWTVWWFLSDWQTSRGSQLMDWNQYGNYLRNLQCTYYLARVLSTWICRNGSEAEIGSTAPNLKVGGGEGWCGVAEAYGLPQLHEFCDVHVLVFLNNVAWINLYCMSLRRGGYPPNLTKVFFCFFFIHAPLNIDSNFTEPNGYIVKWIPLCFSNSYMTACMYIHFIWLSYALNEG